MLKYNPKGALSPALAKVMQKIANLIREHDLMASVTISDGKHGEFYLAIDPSWSCCSQSKLPGGDIQVRIRSQRAEYKTTADQKRHIEETLNGLAIVNKCNSYHKESLHSVLADLSKVMAFTTYGEEFRGHTADPPDPDKVPATLEEAADLIHATLDEGQIKWVKETNLYDALPQLRHGFGQQLRNSWSLWEDGPLRKHVQERLGLFGHGDDLSALVFTALWAKVRGDEVFPDLVAEADGMKAHWRSMGINPLTGEKGTIVP